MVGFYTIGTAFLAAASLVQAHPGESEEHLQTELEARNNYIASLKNSNLASCARKLKKRDASGVSGIEAITQRRMQKVKLLRRNLGLDEESK